MKTSSKLIAALFMVAALFFTTTAKAQTTPANTLRMSIGVDAGLPTCNLTIGSNFVLGGPSIYSMGYVIILTFHLPPAPIIFFAK
ncbi:MAG: hypothetical protein ACHQHN_11950 [Sphingobacteriales bacterium]